MPVRDRRCLKCFTITRQRVGLSRFIQPNVNEDATFAPSRNNFPEHHWLLFVMSRTNRFGLNACSLCSPHRNSFRLHIKRIHLVGCRDAKSQQKKNEQSRTLRDDCFATSETTASVLNCMVCSPTPEICDEVGPVCIMSLGHVDTSS